MMALHRHAITSVLAQSYASTSSSYYSATGRWTHFSRALHASVEPTPKSKSRKETLEDAADMLREKKRAKLVEYKRRQDGQTFLDHLICDVRSGKGGDGSVAFHREKFKPNGPPSGGNGGAGGSVYIRCTPQLNSLSSIKKQLHAAPGSNGRGTWKHGRSGQDTIVEVPVGTIVKGKRVFTEAEEDADAAENRWVHYPLYAETNVESEWFRKAEDALIKEERAEARARRREALSNGGGTPANDGSGTTHDIFLDLTSPTPASSPGHLICCGGAGGYGNPHFSTLENRSPKWATRGRMGERVQLELELKLLADVGLVGLPNAGKSTVLRALTRSKAEVASYAFTTLNPQVGMVRVLDMFDEDRADGGWDADDDVSVIEDSVVERERGRYAMESGGVDVASGSGSGRHSTAVDVTESFRFTIADNPGLIARASENVGLGHSFLRSIERSLALVYVVDLTSDAPSALRTLKSELEQYKPGLSQQVRMVLANKADLLGTEGDEEAVQQAREKLEELRRVVRDEISSEDQQEIEVIPISGKFKANLGPAVRKMAQYVREARERQAAEQAAGPTVVPLPLSPPPPPPPSPSSSPSA